MICCSFALILAIAEQLVELRLPEDRAHRRLRDQARRKEIVLDTNDGRFGVHDAEVRDGVHSHRDVVAGDRLLARDVERHGTQVDLHHAIDNRDDEEDAGPAGTDEATEPEDDTALVLLDDLDRRGHQADDEGRHGEQCGQPEHEIHRVPPAGRG